MILAIIASECPLILSTQLDDLQKVERSTGVIGYTAVKALTGADILTLEEAHQYLAMTKANLPDERLHHILNVSGTLQKTLDEVETHLSEMGPIIGQGHRDLRKFLSWKAGMIRDVKEMRRGFLDRASFHQSAVRIHETHYRSY